MFGVTLVQAEWEVLIEHACGERMSAKAYAMVGCGSIDDIQFLNLMSMMGKYKDMANEESERRYPGENVAGGRRDAFRHTYWNALIANEYGARFAFDLTTAHERNKIASDHQEAMDLYNNEQGRLAAGALKGDRNFHETAPHYIGYLVETGQVLAVYQTWNGETQEGENFRLVPSNQVPRGYLYQTAGEKKKLPSVDPSRLPCGTTAGGRCADR